MLKYRLMLGPVLFAVLIAALWLDELLDRTPTPGWLRGSGEGSTGYWGATLPPGLALLALGLVIVPMAARELGRIFRASGVQASRRWLAIAAASGILVFATVPFGLDGVTAVATVSTVGILVLLGSLLWHIRGKDLKGATAAVGAAMFAFIYLGLAFGFVMALRREQSAWVVLGVLVVTKSCDIGAYFTGRAIGRHKLIPWVSPGKTWEGLFGGMVLAAVVAVGAVWVASRTLGATTGPGSLAWWHAAAIGGLFAITGQAGDLLASVLKRDAGIKDSGKIPGFGGVLDLVDSILLVAPVAYWTLARV